jgi:ABC-2 type transport system permease protein
MKKYLSVFKISFEDGFVYPVNFIMWRVRTVVQILIAYFLWDTVFMDPTREVFGYNRARIMTYVLGLIIVRSVVLSARSGEVAGELSRGDLTNYLVKPVNYLRYWFTRDMADKVMNILFGIVEFTLIILVLKPTIFLQTNPAYLLIFLALMVLAVIAFFFLLFIFSSFTAWYPNQAWAAAFFLMIFVEFLGGGFFPIDVLPPVVQNIIYLTPFPYLLFYPLQVYLGKFSLAMSLRGLAIAFVWVVLLIFLVKKMWKEAVKVYDVAGR